MDNINISTTQEVAISLNTDDIEVVNLEDYYTKEESDERFQPIGDYVTNPELDAKGYITTIPGEYITESELNSKGYLTQHQPLKTINGESLVGTGDITIKGGSGGGSVDLSDYYTKEESDGKFQPVGTYLTSVPDEYVTDTELESKGYLTQHQSLKTVNGNSLVGTGNITIEASAPSNMVTTNTTQGISGTKTFYDNCIFNAGAEFANEVRMNAGSTGDVDIAMGKLCAFKVKPAQISNLYTYKVMAGNHGESDGKIHFMDINGNTNYAVIDSTGISELGTPLSTKYQAALVSGTNIKTINGTSILGSGDITIEGGSGSVDLSDYYTKTETDTLLSNVPEGAKIVSLTQSEYDALTTKDENTFYNITDAEALCYTKAEADEKFITEHQTLKTINGESIVGSGDITIEGGSTDLTNYYTKTEIDEKIGDISTLLAEI